ncbi:glycoside hydrolase family 6 protein [Streptomyces sp. NPDC096013]|uniref:glycoside hydrolase family 6 protein n=1 Tax=Streptomyces sp. NPDC096013 TaxID=3366069 RepID=UPI0037FA96B8
MYGSQGTPVPYGTRASALVLGAALLIAGCSSSAAGDRNPDPGAKITQQPGTADAIWVDPDTNAARQLAAYAAAGNTADAGQIRKIAEQPTGEWIGADHPKARAQAVTEAATRAGRTALLVLYNIPHRDCGQYSQGGASDGRAYRAWIDEVTQGIADRRATVILEPDALLHLVDGCTPARFQAERYDLLAHAITELTALKNTRVYLDAGNAGWAHPDEIHQPLRRAGIAKADGFAVNVSNFYSTQDSITYGRQLSAQAAGKPFVIDTSRNGNGPYTAGDTGENWCNPPGRALGETPTTKTADPLVDAYLWIKRPGESDGACRGGPKAGTWWPSYALRLARASDR